MRLKVSEVSAYAVVALLFWVSGKVEHYGGDCITEKAAHLMASMKQKTRERERKGRRAGSQCPLQGHTLDCLISLH